MVLGLGVSQRVCIRDLGIYFHDATHSHSHPADTRLAGPIYNKSSVGSIHSERLSLLTFRIFTSIISHASVCCM
jgi:hypothetical protein